MVIARSDSWLFWFAGWLTGTEIKEVIKSVVWEGFFSTDNKFLVDAAFAFTHPINLAN